jgi:VWFA-related protein
MKALTTAIVLALGTARSFAAADQEPPVFPAAVDIVAVDVNVVDAQGRPVRRLTTDDFSLTVDGKPRALASVEYVDLDGTSEPTEAKPRSPYFSTNAGAPRGRLVLIVVDQANIRVGGGRAVMNAADQLLDRLTPADRTGLIAIPPPGPSVELTAEHALVREALKKVTGRARFTGPTLGLTEALAYVDHDSIRWSQVTDRECGQIADEKQREACIRQLEGEAQEVGIRYRAESQASFKSLGAVFEALKTIEGPKTVLLITEGLSDFEGMGAITEMASRAAAARVSLYVLRLDGGGGFADAERSRPNQSAFEDEDVRRRGIDALASVARGAVFNVVGSAEAVFDRISRELTGYYLLGFEAHAGDRDGRDHAIRVQVNRRNLTVRSRSRLTIPAAGSGPKDEEAVVATMRAPFLATDLTVRVASWAMGDPASGKVRMIVAAEVEKARGGVTVGFVLADGKGKAVGSNAQRLPASADAGPQAFLGTALVEPGEYTLKLAAIDGTGRRGSVEHVAKAALVSAGGLELGDLLVGRPPAPGAVLRPSVDLKADAAGLTARVEMYGKDAERLGKAAVVLEVAEAETGPALLRLSVPSAEAPEGGRRVAQATLPLGLLPPGDYMVRAAVSVGEKPVAGLRRPFHLAHVAGAALRSGGIPIEGLAPTIGRFDPADALRPDVVGFFLDRMGKLIPGAPPAAIQAASERARKGQPEAILDALSGTTADDPRVFFLRGIGLLAQGQPAAAATQLRGALRLAADLLPAAFYLGACSAASGEDRQAAGAWQTALVSETGHPAVYRLLADALLRVNEPQPALDVLGEAAGRWPDDDGLRRRLGIAHAMVGHDREALAALQPYLEHHPNDSGALFVMLRLLFQQFSVAPGAHPAGAERAQLVRYARSYVEAKGPNQEIVTRWLKYLESEPR